MNEEILSKYEIVLGMEVHMQLNSEMKMFCSCKNDPFFSEPNVNVCPTCLGLPGAMPVANKDAIESAQKMAIALGGNLSREIIFERKNYFYPDLPKSFQITCPHYPISMGGEFDLSYFGIESQIKWREIHLEEDTGKSIHEDKTYLDFNKSGVPLLEMVTEPDFHSIEHAVIFCKEIQLIARKLKVSNADMEKGQMRLEANISVRRIGDTNLPSYRVELKNINSFGFMRKALSYEYRRQAEALENGEKLHQETRGFDELKQSTFVQRSKEEANDYRYFPEPDIPPVIFSESDIEQITTLLPELPSEIRLRLDQLDIPKNYIDILVDDDGRLNKLQELISIFNIEPKKAAVLCIEYPQNIEKSAKQIADEENSKNSEKISDVGVIEEVVKKVLESNQPNVELYKSGKATVLQFLIGQVMREMKGKADAKIVNDLMRKELEKA